MAVFAVVSVSTRRSPRTNSHSPARLFPSHRWNHLHRGFHHRPVDEETKLELPLRETPCSLSTSLDLDHELLAFLSSEQSREASLSCLTTSLAANSDSSRPYCNATFQCRSNNERANSRDRSSDGSGRGSRSSGCLVVVVVSLFAFSRLLRGAKKHQPAVDFRVLATSHVPAADLEFSLNCSTHIARRSRCGDWPLSAMCRLGARRCSFFCAALNKRPSLCGVSWWLADFAQGGAQCRFGVVTGRVAVISHRSHVTRDPL